jgi:hypothetical protein
MPVGGGPDFSDGVDGWVATGEAYFQAQALVAIEREEMVIHLEARFEREAIHRGDVGKE